jgi:hypothetical protein
MLSVKLQVGAGDTIEGTAAAAVLIAHKLGLPVSFTFNDIPLEVQPDYSKEQIVLLYEYRRVCRVEAEKVA